jgi:hypothetical protein
MRLPGLIICMFVAAAVGRAEDKSVTWTGWFSDLHCASSRAASGIISGTNPECSKKCLEEGVAAVFVSEQAKGVFKINGAISVIEDLGYHVEVQARVDEAAKTITIQNVKRLEYEGAACGRPKKTGEK